MEDSGKRTLHELMTGIVVLNLIFLLIAIFVTRPLTWVLGELIGMCVALFMILHMYYSLEQAMLYDKKTATKKTKRSAVLRMVIMAAAVATAALLPQYVSIFSVLLGILTLKFSAYLQPVTHTFFTKILKKGR